MSSSVDGRAGHVRPLTLQGKHIVITNPSTGQTANAEISDLCPGCKSGDLDLSEGLFSFLNNGNMDAGIFEMEWNYVS